MKRITSLSLFLMAITSLSGCNNVSVEHNLIFSEICVGRAVRDRAVEIYNCSEKEIALKDYQIAIYRDTYKNAEPTEIIPLTGVLAPKTTYVVAYSDACEEILSKADLISEKLMTDGSFPMTITYKNIFVVDSIGYMGYTTNIAEHTDLVRKLDHLKYEEKYDPFSFIRYPVDTYTNLGNINSVTSEEIYEGPKLTEEHFKTPLKLL
jgi:predicted extracellular nuclease